MDLYFRKKAQMEGEKKPVVVDVKLEIEKKRALSPAPVRSTSIVVDRKVCYKNDLDDFKKQIKEDFNNEIANIILKQDELGKKIQDLVSTVETLDKSFESTKMEKLKDALNGSIRECSDNLRTIATEIVQHLDEINSLKSRVDTVEAVL